MIHKIMKKIDRICCPVDHSSSGKEEPALLLTPPQGAIDPEEVTEDSENKAQRDTKYVFRLNTNLEE